MRNAARGLSLLLVTAAAVDARADSVAQVATAKRISRQTVALIDPQGKPVDAGGGGGNSLVKVGDVLTFVIQFTPVPNGAYRGLGGYITDYVPPNTEVVGARIIDRFGNTVAPHRGGLSCDGYGPRGSGSWTTGVGEGTLTQGSMSQLYADTGIFYSTDPRTARDSRTVQANPTTQQAFLTVKNGLQMPANPSGAGQFDGLLNASSPYFAHNAWDLAQVAEFGPGSGNTPEHVGSSGIGYGSPVAGPDSWYKLEVTVDPPSSPVAAVNTKFLGNVGPWKRIRQTGSEIGRRGQGDNPPSAAQSTNAYLKCPGDAPTRVGIVTTAGEPVTTSNPVQANAVRFALGELVVGDEYFAEISLRVKALPLDPTFGNINCAEVAGGDASARSQNGGTGGKDHLWRYFLPAPACVSLDLLFENNVDKVLATSNSTLTNTIEAKNLTTSPMTGVVVKDCFDAGAESFVAAGTTPGYTQMSGTAAGCPDGNNQSALVWNVGTLAPGEEKTYIVKFTGKGSTTNQAVFTSNTFPAPGFVANAYTTIGTLAIMRLDVAAAPTYVPTLPGTVHYTGTLRNVGTGDASFIDATFDLPATALPWTYVAGSTKVNGAAVTGNPVQTGTKLRYTPAATLLPTAVAAGGTVTVEFDVTVPAGTAAGIHTTNLTTWVKSAQDFEDSVFRVAPVAVLTARSESPIVNVPLAQGGTSVSGKSNEAVGSLVKVYVNGNVVGNGTVSGTGSFSVNVPPLVAGQRVEVTITGAGELESNPAPTPPVIVVATAGAVDPTPKAACSDGIDNDGDGKVDYPDDPACCSFLDDSESKDGGACVKPPKCADGLDNDGDGLIDFPFDPGCASPLDDDENDVPTADAGTGTDGGGGGGGTDGGSGSSPGRPAGATPPDPGGVPEDFGADGCGCRVAEGHGTAVPVFVAASAIAFLASRRRRRR